MTELPVEPMGSASRPRFSAHEIASMLELPPPTDQQRAVIESDLGPALVIAGAGSGKTETMASRVLWLLANDLVKPGEILGLTFTRKAAGELATRVQERIAELAKTEASPADHDPLDPPVIATYNSFAHTIFRDNAMLIGREGDGPVLGEASAWQLARSVVAASRDPRLADFDKSLDSVTSAVLELSHAMSENVVPAESVTKMAERFAALVELPTGGRGEYKDVLALIDSVSALPVLVELAKEFSAAKARNGFVEYADQVALALQVIRAAPQVAQEYRSQFKVVLLDEYQDTSVVQTWLLSELFSGHCVMAVGDPNQSIYGWRGASAANLEQFAAQFSGGQPVSSFALSTSWRNGRKILAAANTIVTPLRTIARIPVEDLTPAETASDLPVEISFSDTLLEEAARVAAWLKGQLDKRTAGKAPTAAMLFRARKTQRVFVDALRDAGVPYHVLGIGGLLEEPEVADLVSALRVVSDPMAGSELIRLLAGSRWRIGVRDIRALHELARWLDSRDLAQRALPDAVKAQLRSSVAQGEGVSIVDALDFLRRAPDGHSQLKQFSSEGLGRMKVAGEVFARLRSRSTLDLLDFVTLVEQDFRLDIEVVANETRPLGSGNIEAFFDALTTFRSVNDGGNVHAFLSWLREAAHRDDLAPRPEDPEPGAVQLMTIHGAKGLERDLIVVPRMVEGELPAKPRDTTGWTSFGELPYEFRGDAAELPEFTWELAESRKDLKDRHGEFKTLVAERHELEERRLAYVAVTRARHSLLLSGSFWATQVNSREPSRYLRELADAGLVSSLPTLDPTAERPEEGSPELVSWPEDPLGSRRGAVEAAAAAVRSAVPEARGNWAREVELLLTERKNAVSASEFVAVPTRVPASRFKDFVSDPAGVASDLLRPMPQKPYRASRLGTLFHGWVEERSGLVGSAELVDAHGGDFDLEDGADAPIDAAELAKLQTIFERSVWASRKPVDVEREIHLPFDGHVVICKIDAVYETDGRYQIVDWKTGKTPKNEEELQQRQLQLALYRLAFARWKGIDANDIDAVFYYVADDLTIAPEHIEDEAELLARWRAAVGQD